MLFNVFSVHGQSYHFTASSEPYVELTDGIPLVTEVWDDPDLAIPIGFNFQYYDTTLQNLYLPSNFSIITLVDDPAASIVANIVLFGADLVDRGILDSTLLSPITYKTFGTVGNRILTVQWKNAGFFGDLLEFGTSTDFVNFQLKLYESTGEIKYVYGPSSVTHPTQDYNGTGGPIIGILEKLDYINDVNLGEIILLAGNPTNPTVVNSYVETHLNGTIPPGTAYSFSRVATATHDLVKVDEKIFYYPNPAIAFITVKDELKSEILSPVKVINDAGQVVKTDNTASTIELDNLPSGIYMVTFQTSDGTVLQKILLMN